MGFKGFRVIEDKDNGFEAFFDGVAALGSMRVKVGIQGAEAKETDKDDGELTMLKLGNIHEFGATIKDGFGKGLKIIIPQRSYIRSTADVFRKKYEGILIRAGRKLIKDPDSFNPKAELFKLGEIMRGDVIRRINKMEIKQDLAESTKKRRGEDGPALIDDGLLIQAITSVVKPI